jgi:hypothetical protein
MPKSNDTLATSVAKKVGGVLGTIAATTTNLIHAPEKSGEPAAAPEPAPSPSKRKPAKVAKKSATPKKRAKKAAKTSQPKKAAKKSSKKRAPKK